MTIPFIHAHAPIFPEYNPETNQYDGLVCLTDTLTPELVLAAYPKGLFPWFCENGIFYWFSLHPRAIVQPEKIHISRSLRKKLRHQKYKVTVNHNFPAVIAACADTPRAGQSGTWIAPEFQAAYTALHRLGHAHSFECWLPDNTGVWRLAGGFYGVQIGRVFYGESMFAWRDNASKIAFACAMPYLADCGIALLDCQQDSEHMQRFGSQTIPFADFRARLGSLNPQHLQRKIGCEMVQQNLS
ncbi:leucyl/phenylalanyl-tRNA--protein transferase [Wielerella bovis]|uniref:leucyl/phenylalanyl-tRNA--protein transferase n=1 Tax=Wielerella bovis TaxID=2917790 RepID=UPI002018421E|nr:leucyl/phenylalanyl-tRNA--protein transferase [Wielerella bovis]ULJ64462.1 leucyl/phenylalanyl-tRNA--protein transferase [Wielerella bovis]